MDGSGDVGLRQAMQRLIDKDAITEVLTRYCRGIDRADADILRSVYWPDAHDDHGAWNGPALGFVDNVVPRLLTMRQTSHVITNISIEFVGPDAARVETYVSAHHEWDWDKGPVENTLGGRYIDEFERRDGEWRIAYRRFVLDWRQERPSAPQHEEWPARTRGGRSPDDLAYGFFKSGWPR